MGDLFLHMHGCAYARPSFLFCTLFVVMGHFQIDVVSEGLKNFAFSQKAEINQNLYLPARTT